jgi:glycosyltransferase involved in cell wall biosynthesis
MRLTEEARNGSTARTPDKIGAPASDPCGPVQALAGSHQPPLSRRTSQLALLTGGGDKPYALGLASTLISQGVAFDFIGSNEVDGPDLHQSSLVRFLNLRGDQRSDVGTLRKVLRVLIYYRRLLWYAATAKPKLFHILWNNKFELIDRTLLLLFYRLLGKRIAFTAHNVNAGRRDNNDSFLNRLTLKIQYWLLDHIFVHTEQMKRELQTDFGVISQKITVIPFGVNNTVPNTALTCLEARQRVGLAASDKAMLFFGNIAPYKGLEYLIEAVAVLARTHPEYRLLIVGRPKNCPTYWEQIQRRISQLGLRPNLIERIEFVPDEETEVYFKAADVLILPYTHIFQSGVLLLGYNFGLPVIGSNVGSLREDVISGKTGYVCRARDSEDLAAAIRTYFDSALYAQLAERRVEISDYARERYSWAKVGEMTRGVYGRLTGDSYFDEVASGNIRTPAS